MNNTIYDVVGYPEAAKNFASNNVVIISVIVISLAVIIALTAGVMIYKKKMKLQK